MPIIDWLDHRIGVRSMVGALLLEGVPGGAKWRYVWGSCLAFVFSIQLITGVLLMTAYSPSSTQAWSSVHYIQYQMDFGWLIRGLHHFGSQTMMVLIGLHMLQVVIAGAQLPPREFNWWSGIFLLSVTFGLGLTGYLLPWDQKGFYATQVATNIASTIPVAGEFMQKMMVGGTEYGNHTLTRFYALHVAILPGTLIVLLVFHIVVFRRHGVTSKQNVAGLVTRPENEHAPGSEEFYPRQAFYDMLACMAVFAVMLGLVFMPSKHGEEWSFGHGHPVAAPGADNADWYEQIAKGGQRGYGANLDAPADRQVPNNSPRPEWYFLFLFQMLKYFKGADEIIGTMVIPNGVMVLLVLLPLFGYGVLRIFGYYLGLLVIMTLLVMVGILTALALMDDAPEGILWGTLKNSDPVKIENAKKFQEGVEESEAAAKRACQLAMNGTPVEGGHYLLRNDPLTKGKKLFETNCGSCHNFTRKDNELFEKSWTGGKTASDLGDFGSKEWVRGLLKDSMQDHYFGLVKKAGKDDAGKEILVPALTGMRGWRAGIERVRKKKTEKEIAEQEKEFDLIAEWLANQSLPKEKRDPLLAKGGLAAFKKAENKCSTCHSFGEETADEGIPDLTNYGSPEWIRGMIMRPGHKSRYGDKNLMPAFLDLDAGPGTELALQQFKETNPGAQNIANLSAVDRELIIRFIVRDYRPVFGGRPVK
jgi:ubiquinol-cytochrome c reductase cytochrome b subunit